MSGPAEDRAAQLAALGRMLARWDAAFGPVGETDRAAAAAAFDDLDTSDDPSAPTGGPHPEAT